MINANKINNNKKYKLIIKLEKCVTQIDNK